MIFLRKFFQIILAYKKRKESNEKYINELLKNIFPNNKYEVGNIIEFPAGDMFWAKTLAIYQIFELDIYKEFPIEKGQLDDTIMHGIERLWLYLVKLNGYYYKKIFKNG